MKSTDYLKYIRKQPCIISGREAEPHHLKAIGMGRNRKRQLPEHYTAIPLARNYHAEVHQIGERAFELKYKINLWKTAYKLLIDWLWNDNG